MYIFTNCPHGHLSIVFIIAAECATRYAMSAHARPRLGKYTRERNLGPQIRMEIRKETRSR